MVAGLHPGGRVVAGGGGGGERVLRRVAVVIHGAAELPRLWWGAGSLKEKKTCRMEKKQRKSDFQMKIRHENSPDMMEENRRGSLEKLCSASPPAAAVLGRHLVLKHHHVLSPL